MEQVRNSGGLFSAMAVSAVLMLAACGSSGGGGYGSSSGGTTPSTVQVVTCPTTSTIDIAIVGLAFSSVDVVVPVNGIVKWTNNDGATPHTVSSPRTAPHSNFDRSVPINGGSVCLKFTAAGTFQYLCTFHTSMTGTVTVQ